MMTGKKSIPSLTKSMDLIKLKVRRLFEIGLPESADTFPAFSAEVGDLVSKFDERSSELEDLYVEKDMIESEEFSKILDDSLAFKRTCRADLSKLARSFEEDISPTPPVSSEANFRPLFLPKLKCPTFSGNTEDKLAFKNFLSTFVNYVSSVRSDAEKLHVLKSYLSGYPAQLISHLSICDVNYQVALNLLKKDFLDVRFIQSKIFDELLDEKISGSSPDAVRKFLTKIRVNLCELQSSHGLDFYDEQSPGAELIGHLVFRKLPKYIRQRFSDKASNNYPSIKFIQDNFSEILRSLEMPDTVFKNPQIPSPSSLPKRNNNFKPTLQNFQTHASPKSSPFKCIFCGGDHRNESCPTYPSAETKVRRCEQLNLCKLCASRFHDTGACRGNSGAFKPCFTCKKKTHFGYLCPGLNGASPTC